MPPRLCARAQTLFGIEPPVFERKDIHVHVPEGQHPRMVPRQALPWLRQLCR